MNTFGGFPLVARSELVLANRLYCPSGKFPARGWILLARKSYDRLDTSVVTHRLEVDKLVLKNLAIVQAQCVTRGLAADIGAVYLVEITDARGVLSNRWFQFPVNRSFNVLSPAYPGAYYADSLNAGVAWTWSGMIESLWELMSLGTYPGLPSAPNGTPTNWNFVGVSAWEALCQILSHLGMTVSCDLTLDAPYGIVSLGAADSTYAALVAKYANSVQDDLEWLDTGAGRTPGTVVVYFRRTNEAFGTEETIRRDSSQWATDAVFEVPVTVSTAVGIHFLWDDFRIRYDYDGTLLAADVLVAQTIAAQRVTQYLSSIGEYTTRTYAGALPFYAGSKVDGVCWSRQHQSWQTQVVRGKLWPEVYSER